ncbi:uncharacterized protein LOC119726883 [Patiria miniata]|uniref:Uncharacterized protein n=1 Tax=Patiria miniata TaxID=46514 RepID=A0A913ZTX7_PATMI|nr:uncharacterized protein LOC119726883 [Patiria miniata]
MDFEDGDRSLGRLILEEEPQAAEKPTPRPPRSCVKEKWELKSEAMNIGVTHTYISHVAALSNNKILVLSKNYSGNSGVLLTASIPNSHQEQLPIPQINGLTDDVRCIAVRKDGKLLALDGRVVKVFNKQHQLLHQFTPGRGSDSQPTCLAVDDCNLIAVGYRDEDEISIHNPDGSLIRRLPAQMIEDYLTMHNHHLIYTNWPKERLVCVGFYGASLSSVDMTRNMQGGCPTGVCCDSDDSIYVAVGRYQTGDILHYSPDGKYIGCVIKGCGYPRGITFTSNGDLVVATGQSVQVYHRV